MNQIYLTRRNLLTLLSKLDRVQEGGISNRTLIKQDDTHPKYPSTPTAVTAVEDEDYYTDRPAGVIHPADAERIKT